MADTPTGETVTPEAPSNNVTPPATPTVNAVDQAEVERLKKEAQQAQMRANQVQNELDKIKKAQEDAERKRLEEKEEYKQLAEQEKAKREEIENRLEAERTAKELKAATDEVFSQFPKEVIEIAEEVGLSLTAADDSAKEALKQKLEKIQTKVTSEAPVKPNNPTATPTNVPEAELLTRMGNGDKEARAQIIGNLEAVKTMRRMAGLEE